MRRYPGMASRGPTTPVPSWKLYENPFYDGVMQTLGVGGGGGSVSARKLAATLWELQDVAQACKTPRSDCSSAARTVSQDESTGSSRTKPVLPPRPNSAARPRTGKSDKSTDNNGSVAYTSRQLAAMQSHIQRLLDKQTKGKSPNTPKQLKKHNESGTEKQQTSEASPEKKPSPDGFSASAELLERLHNLEQQHTSTTLTDALRTELDVAREKVKELETANRLSRKEIDTLLQKIAEDKAEHTHGKEQEKVKQALQSVRDETEEERKSKRRMELTNRKLTRELGEAKMTLSKVMQELERERKARELMEDVCDELAREIGDDKAEVEELKRESARIKQEVEEERRMLQMAEVWREERVHMKLVEAREEIQAKVAELDKLRDKLEEFLRFRRRVVDDGDYASQQADIREAEMLRASLDGVVSRNKTSEAQRVDDIESLDDDLHSIDLTKEASVSLDSDKLSWNKLVEEHRHKLMNKSKKIYCSPNEESSGGEQESFPLWKRAEGKKASENTEQVIQALGSRSTASRISNGRVKRPFFQTSEQSVGGSKCETVSTETCTATSSEFELPLQGSSLGENKSYTGHGRNLKSFVEWTARNVPNGMTKPRL